MSDIMSTVGYLAPDGGSLYHGHIRTGEGRGDGVAETSPARAHLHVQRVRPWVDKPPEELEDCVMAFFLLNENEKTPCDSCE